MAEKSAADRQGTAAMDTERSTVSVDKVTTELEGVNLVTKGKQLRDIECWFCHAKGHMQRQCKQFRLRERNGDKIKRKKIKEEP